MPVEFLTKEQEQRYGRYTGDPTPAQLAGYFHLSDTDHKQIAQRQSEINRLGYAIQLGTVRYLGAFLPNPINVPDVVVDYLAKQLDITNFSGLSDYSRSRTHFNHATDIKEFYGYHDFGDSSESFRLVRWLYTRAWVSDERPSVLFDLATARLVERKVLLPGVTVLARLVSRVRARVALRLWRILAGLVNSEQQRRLFALLVADTETHQTDLDRLRRAPTRISGPALVLALNRLEEIRALGVGDLSLAGIPHSRIKLAFAHQFEKRAMDDGLDLFDLLMTEILKDAKNTGEKERIRTIRDLDAAARRLATASEILLDGTTNDADIRKSVFARVSPGELREAIATVEALAREPDDNYYPELIRNYLKVRRFLPTLLNGNFANNQNPPLLKGLSVFSLKWTFFRAR